MSVKEHTQQSDPIMCMSHCPMMVMKSTYLFQIQKKNVLLLRLPQKKDPVSIVELRV